MSLSFHRFNKRLLDTMDCPCSALALNCCQFGCFIHDEPLCMYESTNAADWMKQLLEVSPTITLRDLILPGSHDSATCSIQKSTLFSAVGKCQNLSMQEQLSRGCRYLDIRMAGTGNTPESVDIYHGFLKGGSLKSILQEIKEFLDAHTNEFLILEIVREYGRDMSPEQSKYALDLIQTTFNTKLYKNNPGLIQLLNGKPLKEFVDAGVQVAVLVHPRIYENFTVDGITYNEQTIVDKYSYYHSGRWMRSQWHNTRNIDQLLEWNLDQVDKFGDNRNLFLNNQFLLTPGVGGVGDVVSLLVGQSSLRPVSFANQLYQKDKLDDFMRQHADKPWNMIMLDFVDLAPALVSFLIGLNFPSKLEILTAAASPGGGAAKSTNVTAKIRKFVKRDKVLYLTNIRQDLELDYDEGKLTIAYSLGGDSSKQILDVDFDVTTEIVVSQYSQNQGVLVHVDPTTEGVFHRGRILKRDEYESMNTKDGTAVAIRSGGAFSIVN